MRLIDADALKKKLEKYDPMLSTLSSFEFVTKEDIDEMPTVCDIEQIRVEIADLDDAEYEFEGYYKAVNDALQIIDKYTKGESE